MHSGKLSVTLAVGRLDHTWYEAEVEIPADTLEERIEEVAKEEYLKATADDGVSFVLLLSYELLPVEF